MHVRDHRSQHEAAEALPLLTESAVVTDVTAMDHNRSASTVRRIRETLDEHGSDAWRRERPPADRAAEDHIRDLLDPVDHLEGGTPLNDYLAGMSRGGAVADRLADLQGRYLQPYPSLLRFDVEADAPKDFVAGQYLAVRYEGVSRAYSVASSPNRDVVEFCVRRVPGGRMTTELAVDLSVGDEVTLRGPYGELALEDPDDRDLLFLATGTGVAPFKSMIDYCFEEGWDRPGGEPRDVWLFLGAAWRDELPYRETFQSYDERYEHFHFVPTLSQERHLTDWAGETAYVQRTLVKYVVDGALEGQDLPSGLDRYRDAEPAYPVDARIDPSAVEVYACGVSAMVDSLVRAVDALGVPAEHTQFEGFG